MSEEKQEETVELAPNMWFAEYGMPYTTVILENEADYAQENPEAAQEDRHPLAQFIIDQETAVVRDYLEGRISEEEFNSFKELSEARIESMEESIDKEIEELGDDAEGVLSEIHIELGKFKEEHGAELEKLMDTVKEREPTSDDVSLHMTADLLGVVFEGTDKVYEMLPPHLHDLFDVVESEALGTAHELLEAREELSSADDHNFDTDRRELDAIEPVFEADIDTAHENIDDAFERIDQDLEEAKEFVETAKEHAELNPGLTVEHMPYQITEDYDAVDQMEEEVGAQV